MDRESSNPRYGKELSEELNEGGCIEIAEKMSEIREKEKVNELTQDSQKTDRRSFFSAAFSGALATVGLRSFLEEAEARSSKRSKEKSETDRKGAAIQSSKPDIHGLKKSQEIKSIQDTAPFNIAAKDAVGYSITLEELGLQIDATVAETSHGEIAYLSDSQGRKEAIHIIDEVEIQNKKLDFGSTGGAIVGHKNSAEFIRPLTNRERLTIAKEIDAPPGKVKGLKGSHVDGYDVFVTEKQQRDVIKYELTHDFNVRQQKRLGDQDVGSFAQTNDTCDGVAVFCYLCVTSADVCWLCGGLCATGVGALACVLCLIHTCGVALPDCYTCADCLT
jgi:hypothetical protein